MLKKLLNSEIVVTHIIHGFSIGGAEKLVFDYLRKFKTDNIKINVISLSKPKDTYFDTFIQENKLDVIYPRDDFIGNSVFTKILAYLRATFYVFKALRKSKSSVIHTHLQVLHIVLFPTILLRIKRRFHTIHSKPENLSKGYLKSFEKIAIKVFKFRVIVLNKKMKLDVDEFYKIDGSIVINNSLDIKDYLTFSKSVNECRNYFLIPTESFVLGNIGRLTPIKNQELLIDMMDILIKTKPDSVLLILGEGELKEHLDAKITELGLCNNIKILENTSFVKEFLKSLDVFLFPSIDEGLGLAFLEAQLMDLKCLISTGVPLESIISDKVILVNDFKVETWIDSIVSNNNFVSKKTNRIFFDNSEVYKKLGNLYIGGE